MSPCKSCIYTANKARRAADMDAYNSYQRDYTQKNKESVKATKARYRHKNADAINTKKRDYQKRTNRDYARRTAQRRAQKLLATPKWLSKDQHQHIKDVYWLCEDLKLTTGLDYNVDHIVPLQGKNVCGLHVPWNLQILPSDVNKSKGNRHDEDD